jgi:hypothetical protein
MVRGLTAPCIGATMLRMNLLATLERAAAMALTIAAANAQGGWQLRTPSPSPPARGYHGLVYDLAAARTVLFGGFDGTFQISLGDTWLWDGATWTNATPATAPAPRWSHTMAYDYWRNRVVLFGGIVGGVFGTNSDETWEWNGVTWTQLQPAVRPSPRRGASMTYDAAHGVCVLFGGGLAGGTDYNDTWEWNGATWTLRTPVTSPPARWQSCLVGDSANGNVLMFGGSWGVFAMAMGDTWIWDGVNWQQRYPLTVPAPRWSAGGAFDVHRGVVVMFGGHVASLYDGTTWIWNGNDWRQDPRQPSPPAQMSFQLAYDTARQRTVKFGGVSGSGSTFSLETWEYELGSMATWSPLGSGCAGPPGAPWLRPMAGSLPIAGATFTLQLTYGIGNMPATIAIGVSDQQWVGGALPQSLAPLGMSGCTLYVSTEWLGSVTLANGNATLAWPLPTTSGALGFRFFAQALVLDPAANPFGAVLSNAGTGQVGAF